MKINCLGGGPASLYFSILMKKAFPQAEITVYEQNRFDDTFGFGVVFSDKTMANFREYDVETHDRIEDAFAHWDDIDIHYKGEVLTSTGHGFAGMSRKDMLIIMQRRAADLGVDLHFETIVKDPEELRDCDLLFAADGVNSITREKYKDRFEPEVDFRPNRFVWMGTTFPFPAFTFHFIKNQHGLFRTHCYRYMEGMSTLILETSEEAFRNTGLEITDEAATKAYTLELMKDYLDGHEVIINRSHWRQFPNIRCGNWTHENVVLAGDAVHTAHFSIGSGTKLAMEDAIALHDAIVGTGEIGKGLARYEEDWKPQVASTQRAARVSEQWFEEAERYYEHLEPIQFGFSLLTRSLRISHENLKLRDANYVKSIDTWFAGIAANQSGVNVKTDPPPPPMFTPFKLRDMVLSNRIVVSPMCQYSAKDGTVNDWHLVHLGSRAIGGAGLVFSEMTDVSREGRISPLCAGMYKDEHVTAWKRIVDFVHANSDAKIGMQLGHAGRKGSTKTPWDGLDMPLDEGNWEIVAPSPIPYVEGVNQVPREMTRADMEKARDDHARAAQRAEEAGFDMLELHCAHGYLLASFVSPLTNVRTDTYGGSLENRMRFPLEVFDAVRAVWPAHKPISVRISATDWAKGGIEAADAVEIARMLKAHGCDIVDVSTGQTVSFEDPVFGRLFQTPFADRVRLEAGIPTMTVGAVSSWEDVNSILAAGRADLCVMARGHLYDPYFTRHAAYDQDYALDWPNPYAALERYTPRMRYVEPEGVLKS
jgi:anthraniloyl-CoA monooxygenase